MKRGWMFAVSAAVAWLPATYAVANGPVVDLDGSGDKPLTLMQYAAEEGMGSPIKTATNDFDGPPQAGGWNEFSYENGTNSVPVVPEPVTMGLVAMGVVAGMRMKRKRR